ncbi:polyprenyl synthetase family protein [Nonomuraea recticatena]|uniref:polyprenyl synthetase family protein n=1 Tax=Nonomuraea recticatena TaxID=46178 RepID=UPI003621BEFC
MPDIGFPAGALARCRQLLEPAMRATVADLHPWTERMAAFTLGWSDIDGTPVEADTGKGLRPALAMLCAEAAGGTFESAVPGAVAVELVHVFSLVHDDIIDSDERRRHRPAVWKAYGVGPAVLAGDALLALAVRSAASGPHAAAAASLLSSALVELVHGQTLDMAFEERPWTGPEAVTVAEYTSMAADKTGSLIGCAAALGVTFAGAPAVLATRMYGMGRDLGLAFQMVDDVLGIWGTLRARASRSSATCAGARRPSPCWPPWPPLCRDPPEPPGPPRAASWRSCSPRGPRTRTPYGWPPTSSRRRAAATGPCPWPPTTPPAPSTRSTPPSRRPVTSAR